MRKPELAATKTPTPATTPALPIFLNSLNKRITKRIDCCWQSRKPFPSHELPQQSQNGDDGTETSQKTSTPATTSQHWTRTSQALSLPAPQYLRSTPKSTQRRQQIQRTVRPVQTTSILHQMASNLGLSTRLLLGEPSF